MSKKSPTLLKVYVIPVLLLSLVLVTWNWLTTYSVHGIPPYLGYVVIAIIGMYLYLMYLCRYLY